MRICVVGAGAIGGLLGVRLALAGNEVTLIDQGPHLAAIKKHGLKLIMGDGTEHVAKPAAATDLLKRRAFSAKCRHDQFRATATGRSTTATG